MIYVGTAGWNVPRAVAENFPKEGTHLQRYAKRLNCVEINTSFYRSHSTSTYQRWAESTAETFRFSVKLSRIITHDDRLRCSQASLKQFIDGIYNLGERLGPVLVQLPPSLEFDVRVASRFFGLLRQLFRGDVVCEPRHSSWLKSRAENLLIDHNISRVAADPALSPIAGEPGGDQRLLYYRLHGSPRTYWSDYPRERLLKWAKEIQQHRQSSSWIIFDNTAAGHATANALQMRDLLK